MKRVIVGITGASGAMYGVRLLERLSELPVETHLIATRGARVTIEHETGRRYSDVRALADVAYAEGDQNAHNLVCRAADVVLKERRPHVLAVRETPLHSVHLRNLLTLSEMGAVVAPPVAAFYTRPGSIDDIVDQTVVSLLDQLGLHLDVPTRWRGLPSAVQDD